MSDDVEALGALYEEITGGTSVTESQEETPSREPIGERETELEQTVAAVAENDGLAEAVDGSEADEGAA